MAADLIEHPTFTFDSELPYNTGLVAVRGDRLRTGRTTIVAGTPRGGTTMVAECLGTLGLPLGIPIPPPRDMFNYEDPDLQAVLHRTEPGSVDRERLRTLVSLRNNKYPRWGFKLPMALNSLPLLEDELRNPTFVFVMRDLVGIASREHIAAGLDVIGAMAQALLWQQRIINFVSESESPCLLISYEKALQFPNLVATALARWAELAADREECQRAAGCIAANRESYLLGVRYQCDQLLVPRPQTWKHRD